LALLLRLVVFAVRAIWLLLIVRLVSRAFSSGSSSPRPSREPFRPGAAELVRDRVCNTFVPKDKALFAAVSGRNEAFCSVQCRDRALREASRAS